MATFPEEYMIWVIDKQTDDMFKNPANHSFSFEDWRAAVLTALKKIASTQAGLALLQSIQSTARWVLVKPLNQAQCNAHGFGQNRWDPATGRSYMGVVAFEPQVYMSGSQCYQKSRGSDPRYNRGSFPDEVCFHELVHAYRGGFGVNSATPLGGGVTLYTDDEEFFAVVLTNIYISDVSNHLKSGLRADHTLKRPLEKELSGSFTFFQSSPQVLPLLDRLVNENYILCSKLAKVKASFNPLTAYFQNYKLAKAMSQSSLAKRRERIVPTLGLPLTPADTIAGTIAKVLEVEALGILRHLP